MSDMTDAEIAQDWIDGIAHLSDDELPNALASLRRNMQRILDSAAEEGSSR